MKTLEGFPQYQFDYVRHNEVMPIAVIGIGCRFPGGIETPQSYWTFLFEKNCGIIEVPPDRWNRDAYFDPDPDIISKARSKWGGFLQGDVFGFDPAFFDMSPREVILMDPQQRLLLQVTYETVQNAGATVTALQRQRTGVFVGISTSDFGYSQKYRGNSPGIFAGTGAAMSIAANRISHRFDFNGPSLAIDTACSSALVAVDQAVRHLHLDTCDVALAGGVNCMLDPATFVAFSSANMLSPTGAIYTFDDRADGFVRSEGCGLVLLKPLQKAIRDQDRIYAVIRSSAVNQDGRTPTLTAPSDAAQTKMLEHLVAKGGVDPEDVGFVEAHGTGTQVGDPIEATAIGRVFGKYRGNKPVAVGSFKPNLGHLESASGIAGLIKTVLSVNRGIILPNRNFENPNPNIPFDALGIRVPTQVEPLQGKAGSALAVVNSFGFGGTNASVLVENWRASPSPKFVRKSNGHDANPTVVPISSGSKAGLKAWAVALADALDAGGTLETAAVEQISAHLKRHRDQLSERAAILATSEPGDLSRKLRSFARGEEVAANDKGPTILAGRAKKRRLAFAFSGQGGQWWAMSRALLRQDAMYRGVVDTFDEAFRPVAGWSVVEEMLRPKEESRINDPDVTQASIFACQIGLYALWTARGLRPELLIGHSFGEVAATYIAGAIDLDTAVRIIYQRGFIPEHSTRRGAMAAIGLTVDQLMPLMPNDDSVVIAAYNGPTAQMISGMEPAVAAVVAEVMKKYPDALARRQTMEFGWHSQHLDDCEAWVRRAIGEISWKTPQIPIVSTVTGILETRFDNEYWWQNLRQPVSYKKAVDFCIDLGIDAFLEFGPHRTVTPLLHGIAQERNASITAVASLDRTADDHWTMARTMGALFVAGVNFDWPHTEEPDRSIELPKAPWANERLLQLPLESKQVLFDGARHPLLGWRELAPEPAWTNEVSLKNFKYLSDHRVSGDCLFPAVGYVEMAAAALWDYFGPGPVELRDIRILEALSIGDDDAIILRTTFDPVSHRLRISSLRRDSDDEWRLRVLAYGWRHDFSLTDSPLDASVLDTPPVLEGREFYKLMQCHGLQYGPKFQAVQRLWLPAEDRLVGEVESSDAVGKSGFIAYPGLLDSVLQSGLPLADYHAGVWKPGSPVAEADQQSGKFPLRLPIGIRKILIAAPLPPKVVVEFRGLKDSTSGSYRIYRPDGVPLAAIENLYTKNLSVGRHLAAQQKGAPAVFEETFVSIALPDALPEQEAKAAGRWLLIGADNDPANRLAGALAAAGAIVERFDPAALADMDVTAAVALVQTLAGEATGLKGIIFMPGSREGASVAQARQLLETAVEELTVNLIAIGQVLDRLRTLPVRPTLTVMTRNARQLPTDGPMSLDGLADSALIGVTRTIASECEEFFVRQVDADEVAFAQPSALAAVLLHQSLETEIVQRGGSTFAARLEQKPLEMVTPRKRLLAKAQDPANFKVAMTAPGVLDNIVLREMETQHPRPGEVVVEVASVGLNFRDIMVATSILPDEIEGEDAWWRNLGIEFAGTVKSAGDGVGLKIGDRIAGMGKGFLRRYARLSATAAIRVPDNIDLAAAATIPVAFTTAHYALEHVARLAKGEKVLIQLATGGVGLAAIQVARHIGAEIYATAGSEQKRAYLRQLGIEHVMNSRSLDFAEELRATTGGRGVDVVLNALSGAGIDKGLECLAPFGRFIEIGKRDLADDKPIGLKSLYCNNSYSVIDLSTLGTERPDLYRRLLDEVAERVASGAYQPLKITTFPVSRVVEAMRLLSKAQHIGKVVVTFDEPEFAVEFNTAVPLSLSRDASYLVTGGLRGFGVTIADWLSKRGAGRLLLAGRSAQIDADVQATINSMTARGTEIVPVALDVTDGPAVHRLVYEHARSDKPLKGIVHGAAVIEDGMLSQLDRARIANVLRPKVAGAWNLHQALVDTKADVDFFVSFSSLAQVLGSKGQANYTAANSVLNAIANYRRAHGLPASAIGWGAIGGSGFVARSEALSSYLDSVGMKTIADVDAANALDLLLRADNANLTFAAVDWATIGRITPSALTNPRLKALFARGPGGQSQVRSELASAPRTAWKDILGAMIRNEVARVLKVNVSDISPDRKLSELGLDSLSSFELKNRIEAQIDINIPVAKFLQTPTVNGLSTVIANAFEASLKVQAATANANAAADARTAQDRSGHLQPLPRQVAATAQCDRSMTSPLGREDCEVAAERAWHGGPIDYETVAEALRGLSNVQDGLRLAAVWPPGGQIELQSGHEPQLERVGSADDLRPVTPERPWRFGMAQDARGTRLCARAHRVAADSLSPYLALAALAAALEGATVLAPTASLGQFQEAAHAEAVRKQGGHLVFWKEVLRSVPPVVTLPHRSRAPAPTGLGSNRGPVGYLEARIPIKGWTGLDLHIQEAMLAASYCNALAGVSEASAVVVERFDEGRRDCGPTDLIGPVADSFPLLLEGLDSQSGHVIDQALHRLALGRNHRAMDTAAIEAAMEGELRERNTALHQFGFWFLDAASAEHTRSLGIADALTSLSQASNEVRLDVEARATGLRLRLGIDTDVVDRKYAEALLVAFAKELASGLTDGASALHPGLDEMRWHVPRTLAERPLREHPQQESPAAPKAATTPAEEHAREVPVATLQHALLQGLLRPDASTSYKNYWSFSRSFRIRPNIDVMRLQRAVSRMSERHEALRTRFTVDAARAIRGFVHRDADGCFSVEDMRGQSEAAILARVDALVDARIDPFRDVLFQIHVIRCGSEGDIIAAKGHHVVGDGWSFGLLLEEMFQAYLGLDLPPLDFSTEDYVRWIDKSDQGDIRARRDAYLRSVYAAPAPQLPKIGRVGRGLPPNLDLVHSAGSRELVVSCTAEGEKQIRERARGAGLTESVLLIAAYAQTIAARGGVDDVIATVPIALRTDRRATGFVGHMAGLAFLRASVKRLPGLQALGADITQQLTQAIELAPFNYAMENTPIRDEIVGSGSYLALYCTGMQTPDRFAFGSSTSAVQRLGVTDELDFGVAKISPIGNRSIVHHNAGVFELDVRSFQGPKGLAYRCAYDVVAFDRAEATDIFAEVLDRMGLPTGGHDGIVALMDETGHPGETSDRRTSGLTTEKA